MTEVERKLEALTERVAEMERKLEALAALIRTALTTSTRPAEKDDKQ